MAKKEVRDLITAAERWPGWRVEQTKNGWMLYPPNKALAPVLIHRTESDHRALRNTLARLRKAGAPV
jgi:hypothetical protein